VRDFTTADRATLSELFEAAYQRLYSRSIPGVDIEILSWVLSLAAPAQGRLADAVAELPSEPKPVARRAVFDIERGEFVDTPVYWRADLAPGAGIKGPAIIAEDETSTVVGPQFEAHIDRFGYIALHAIES
jgi:N-methylhydantoinase A